MTTKLTRVLHMSGEELSFRVKGMVRTQRERVTTRLRGVSWNRSDLTSVLAPGVMDRSLRNSIANRDWQRVARRVRATLTDRPARFVIDPGAARSLAREVAQRWPNAPVAAARAGDAILAGRYEILGYPSVSYRRGDRLIDWHYDPVHDRVAPLQFWADVPFLDARYGDHKIIWEINRHQYFLALGRAYWLTRDRRYAERIVGDVQDWLTANPPLTGINWASMLELGFRSLSWVTAIHFLLGDGTANDTVPDGSAPDDTWLLDVLLGLARQLTHVEHHLSQYFSPNTHLTGEALALYVVGVALPELADSARWVTLGKSILLREISRQIHHDGGHAELSTCYHRYTLDFYNLALITAEIEGDAATADAFRDAVHRLRRYLELFAAPDGSIPLIGDEDGGQLWNFPGSEPKNVRSSLTLAALLTDSSDGAHDIPEETLWLAWHVRPAVRDIRLRAINPAARPALALDVHHLADSGYVVARTASGDRLTFDTGHHGYLNGGHAHADALSITLNLQSTPFLIDPGSATYTMDPALRARLRESSGHNTLTLDGRSSAVPHGPFHWKTRATARLASLVANPGLMAIEATHDGFAPAEHRRLIVRSEGTGWFIIDYASGGTSCIDAHWHFDPAWHVDSPGPGQLLATGPTGTRAWLLHSDGSADLVRGGDALGWCSPRYGSHVPTFSARIHHRGERPLTTWIGTDDDTPDPRIERVGSTDSAHTAVRVRHRHGTMLTVAAPLTATLPGLATFDDLTTDARIAQAMITHDGTVSVSIIDGCRVSTAEVPLEITCSERVHDLWVRCRQDVAELWSSRPPSSLRLRFSDGHQPHRLRLNGRDMVGGTQKSGMVIHASSWSQPIGTLKEWAEGSRGAVH